MGQIRKILISPYPLLFVSYRPTPCYLCHFQVFYKINSFLKNVLNFLDSKKVKLQL